MTFAAAPAGAPRRRRATASASSSHAPRTTSDIASSATCPTSSTPGDLVVVNTSATIAGEADATSTTRGRVVVHVATRLDDGTYVVELRTAPDAARAILDAEPGETVTLDGADPDPARRRTRSEHSVPHRRRQPPLAGGGERRPAGDPGEDRDGRSPTATSTAATRSPTTRPCSASTRAARRCRRPRDRSPPTSSRRLITKGVGVSPVTLHTGLSSQEAGEAPQAERFRVPQVTAEAVNAAKARGGRVVAVGTTVTRALESAVDADGRVLREQRLDRAGHLPATTPPASSTGWSPAGTTPRPRT